MTEMTDTLLTSIAAVLLIVLEIFRIRRAKKINIIDAAAPPPTDVCQRCPLMWEFRSKIENEARKRIRQTRN